MGGARLFLGVLVKPHPFSVPQLPSFRMGHMSTSQVLGNPAQKQWPLSLQTRHQLHLVALTTETQLSAYLVSQGLRLSEF